MEREKRGGEGGVAKNRENVRKGANKSCASALSFEGFFPGPLSQNPISELI